MTLTWYRHFKRNGGLNQILKRQTSRFYYGSNVHSMDRQINHNTDQRDKKSEEVPVTPLKSLVSVCSVVAVITDDSDFDYYL
jgi:hypothetical protein